MLGDGCKVRTGHRLIVESLLAKSPGAAWTTARFITPVSTISAAGAATTFPFYGRLSDTATLLVLAALFASMAIIVAATGSAPGDEKALVELERSVRRCLEKSPEARFQSASDLAYNLRSISTDHAIPPARAPRRDVLYAPYSHHVGDEE